MMTDFKKYLELNKEAWNSRTPTHLTSKFYNQNKFFKEKNSLNSIELDSLGDINEKTLLHLQCHFGQDSISLQRMGAHVTAIDFSEIAIATAKRLNNDINTNVDFIEGDVLNINLNKKFDLVFSSYGVIGWLPDLNSWAKTISKHLKKGGEFLLTEFHPFLHLMVDDDQDYFFDPKPHIEKSSNTYTDGKLHNETTTCWWNHSLTEIFIALETNGLKLLHFEEFDYSPYKLEGMTERSNKKFVLEEKIKNRLPYVFNLKAIKK
jgi:SAM-dependent methyltransferase